MRCVNENRKKRKRLRWQSRNKRKRQPIGMLGRSSGNHDWLLVNASACAFLAVFVYATHAKQAIAFEWKSGLSRRTALRATVSIGLSCGRLVAIHGGWRGRGNRPLNFLDLLSVFAVMKLSYYNTRDVYTSIL